MPVTSAKISSDTRPRDPMTLRIRQPAKWCSQILHVCRSPRPFLRRGLAPPDDKTCLQTVYQCAVPLFASRFPNNGPQDGPLL